MQETGKGGGGGEGGGKEETPSTPQPNPREETPNTEKPTENEQKRRLGRGKKPEKHHEEKETENAGGSHATKQMRKVIVLCSSRP